MTEIFLSFDSGDRERVRPVVEALSQQGFGVLSEQDAPEGAEWESWVSRQLSRCRCVVELRSATLSNKMQLVAEIAETHGKLVSVRLEPRNPWQSAGGAVELVNWTGDADHAGWKELLHRVEEKLKTAGWVQRLVRAAETEAADWRARYESSKAQFDDLNTQLAAARSALGSADAKAAGLQAQIEQTAKALSRQEARIVELERLLAGAELKHAETRVRLQAELGRTAARLNEAQEALSRELEKMQRLDTELADAKTGAAQVPRLEVEVARKEEEIARLNEYIADRNSRIEFLQNTILELEQRAPDLEKRIGELPNRGPLWRLRLAVKNVIARLAREPRRG